jgi:hypothetical protein
MVGTRTSIHRAAMTAAATAAVIFGLAQTAVAGRRHVEVSVESEPTGALVSVHLTADAEPTGGLMVAGETPLERSFRFPKTGGLWLRLEKRGFEPAVVELAPDATRVKVELTPLEDPVPDLEPIAVLAVVEPRLTVIRRGFSKETEDEPAGEAGADALARAMADRLGGSVETVVIGNDDAPDALRRLWRDAESQMELVDPIRLPFMSVPPTLEGRSARDAAVALAEQTGADAILFVAGRANVETGGMKAGKIGMMAAGTACSFASGYANAMSSGSDFFTYTIYLPSFAEGMGLEAVLVDTRTGFIRWANKGLWKPLPLDHPEAADHVAGDLLTGLEDQLGVAKPNETQEEP